MNLPSILALLVLVVGVPLNVYVTWKLWRLLRSDPGILVLRERVVVALAVLLLILVFGLIFLNNDLDAPVLTFDETKLYTRAVTAILAFVPATYFLWISRGSEPG